MDLRIEKTERGIKNAFIELRSKKPLEKITVKELCESARINKSTFYAHYKDIYDLSDAMEEEVVQSIANSIQHPEYLLEHPDGLCIAEFPDDDFIFRQSGKSFCG